MTSNSKPLTRLTDPQKQGADPSANAWMSASAGTGKTQVLTARIKRLLLSGVPPHAILAITFTKAGAAEMARRVRKDLADWVRLDDAALGHELFAIGDPHHDRAERRALARTLFAKVIDATGGGLAIQTIHSFCQSLLGGFPEEAGLAPGFRALDEAEIADLRSSTLSDMVAHAERHDPALAKRIADLALAFDEGTLRSYLNRCAGAADALDALPAGLGPWVRSIFGLPTEPTPAAWLASHCGDDAVGATDLHAIAECCAAWTSAKAGAERAAAIRTWLALAPEDRGAAIGDLFAVFATAKGELRKDWSNSKALVAVTDLAVRCHQRLSDITATHRHMITADRLADGLEVGRAFARAVQDRKRREGVVDFDDLIRLTARLLAEPGRADWIRYKLDTRIDHILVDEAQDTNEAQWQIVWALAEEFFAGKGAKDGLVRTLFVVGDYKQAIYGFQGTSPENFMGARAKFFERGDATAHPFADVPINENFRSSPPVLRVVDAVMAHLGPDRLGKGVQQIAHVSSVPAAAGRVVLWPTELPTAKDAEEDRADDAAEEGWIDSATRRVADKIALSVRQWIDQGIDGEEVRPGDVMILVRKRTDLAGLLVSRLQSQAVPVAGVDRLQLKVPIAVQDLLAAARFALQPLDSLSLASLLVSPLIGWSHDDLIAHGWRPDPRAPLWPHLRERAAQGELDRAAIQPLFDLLNMAGNVTPHRFFETILSGPMQGRAKLLARLGNAARDPIEELVSKALDYQTRESVSLLGFVSAFDRGEVEIKRELDNDVDEVRVMTVHGSKGLQARIVILADATSDPAARKERGLDWPVDGGKVPLLPVRKDDRPTVLAAIADKLAEAEMQEHWRLLYVAMTRAERMLFVAGALGRRAQDEQPPEDSWYAAIRPVVEAMGEGWEPTDGGIWHSECVYAVGGREPRGSRTVAASAPVMVPEWARVAAPAEPRPLRPLAPSSLGERESLEVPQPPVAPHLPGLAAERGVLMHALFERLPPVVPEQRRDVAARWLARMGSALDAPTQAAMIDAVLAVLDDPAYAALFGPGSLAEVPFSALVGGQVVAGSMDRLLVTDTAVRVIDYKTGALVPESAGTVPEGYLRQMAAYAAALAVILPDKRVEAALLFTGGPRLIDLPPALLERHKPGLGGDKANSPVVA